MEATTKPDKPDKPQRTRKERERLFTANQKLAYATLRDWTRKHSGFVARYRLETEDLEAVAMAGLWHATGTWEPARSQFSTFAVITICSKLGHVLAPFARAKRGYGEVQILSLDAPLPGSEERRRIDTLAAPETDAPHVAALRALAVPVLQTAVDALPPRQREAVRLYYYEGLTLADAAACMGLSRQRVQQLTKQSLDALRVKCSQLDPFSTPC